MSGGRRKSRKPQKWEDYVADEEQLASIEKELVKEEKARMKSASNDGDSSEKSPDNDQNEDEIDIEGNEDNSTDEEEDLEISIFKEEEKELEADELNKKEISEDEKGESGVKSVKLSLSIFHRQFHSSYIQMLPEVDQDSSATLDINIVGSLAENMWCMVIH